MTSDRDRLSNAAFTYGRAFGDAHSFSEFKDDKDSARLMAHCPRHLDDFADVFKYGCQSAWRRRGDLPNMIAYDLEPGDWFKVEPPDPESSIRVCLSNQRGCIRFGWPNNSKFWSHMGSQVSVGLVPKP